MVDIGHFGKVFEAVKSFGVPVEETIFFIPAEKRGFFNEIPAHAIGDGGHGAGIVRAPHQLFDTAEIPGFQDGPDGGGIGIVFAVEEPGDAAAFDKDIRKAGQADLPGTVTMPK